MITEVPLIFLNAGLRLLGIGRNQYIDLMNQSRSTRKFGFFRKSGRDLLPVVPVDAVPIQPWWMLQVGYVTEEDMKVGWVRQVQIEAGRLH